MSGDGIRTETDLYAVAPGAIYQAAEAVPSPCGARRAAAAIITNAQPLNSISIPNSMPITHSALVGN